MNCIAVTQYANKNSNNRGRRPQDRRVSELKIRTSPLQGIMSQ